MESTYHILFFVKIKHIKMMDCCNWDKGKIEELSVHIRIYFIYN